MSDFYDSPLSRVLGVLVVAIPLTLVVGGAIAFRASGAVAQGAPLWIAVLVPAIGFTTAFGTWYLFARGRAMRRSAFTASAKVDHAADRRRAPDADRPPLEQALQPDASASAHNGKE